MSDFKLKYIIYKKKYLNLKNKYLLLNGGQIDDEKFRYLESKGCSFEVILLLKNLEEISGVDFTDEQLNEFIGIKKLEDFKLPTSDITINTQPNPGTNNTCMYLSLRDILIRTGIVENITVQQLRFIGGLDPNIDGIMWDSDIEQHREALQRICDYFNITVQIRTRFNRTMVQGYFFSPLVEHPQRPLEVYIMHEGLHFEAITEIIEGGNTQYDINRQRDINRRRRVFNDHDQLRVLQSFVNDITQNTNELCKTSTVKQKMEVSGGIIITQFTKDYYEAIVNHKVLDGSQTIYNNLINLLSDTRVTLSNMQKKYEERIRKQKKFIEEIKLVNTKESKELLKDAKIELDRMENKIKASEKQTNDVIQMLLDQINSYN